MPKKDDVKPLFEVKHAFVDSLEAHIQASMMLALAVRTVLDLKQIPNERVAATLKEKYDAWEKATLTRNDADEKYAQGDHT